MTTETKMVTLAVASATAGSLLATLAPNSLEWSRLRLLAQPQALCSLRSHQTCLNGNACGC